jgi:hypothetical protein
MFCRSLFVLLYFFFWPLCCLWFTDSDYLPLIYGFWLPLWYLQTLLTEHNKLRLRHIMLEIYQYSLYSVKLKTGHGFIRYWSPPITRKRTITSRVSSLNTKRETTTYDIGNLSIQYVQCINKTGHALYHRILNDKKYKWTRHCDLLKILNDKKYKWIRQCDLLKILNDKKYKWIRHCDLLKIRSENIMIGTKTKPQQHETFTIQT